MKKLKRKVLVEFYEYLFIFDFKKINSLLLHRSYDHKIELQSKIKSLTRKAYGLSRQ